MNPLKDWLVDVMAAGLYQGDRGPTFWLAVTLRVAWGREFDRA